MTTIIQKDNPILRKHAREVQEEEFSSEYIRSLLDRMKEALDREHDGVAIAAPQIGESVRVFLVSGKAFQHIKDTTDPLPDKAYINPVLLKSSKETDYMEEGCLSVRWWYGKVKRAKKVKIKAFTENGEPFQEGATGLLSQIFQHEIDHLDGILFSDKATELEDNPPHENE